MSIKEIIPILAAVIGLTPVFLKWLNDRSSEAAKRRSVQYAKEQVEFWQTWIQAQREVTTDEQFADLKKKVSQRLDKLILQNTDVDNQEKNNLNGKTGTTFLQRVLLAYFPHTPLGWVFHTTYYILISFTLLFLYGSFLPTDDINADPSWSYFLSELDVTLPLLIFFAAIGFVLQRLAIRTEKRYIRKSSTEEN